MPDPIRDQLAEVTGCAPLMDSGGAVWCENHSDDWPCRMGRALAIAESYAAQQAAKALHKAADALDDQARSCDDDGDDRGCAAYGWAAEVVRARAATFDQGA